MIFKEQLKQWKQDHLAARKHGQKKPQKTRSEVLSDADIQKSHGHESSTLRT